jgi:ATP-dependent DNA helicase RecG
MRQTEDGFEIAEKDAVLRGFGDLLGVQQSGQLRTRFADLAIDGELLEIARTQARMEVEADPELNGQRADKLKNLLYLFEQDQALLLLGSG